MDLFSFSPSLLPILSLLNRTDIARCRLVNKRFCQTINNNRRISPRKAICIFIQRFVEHPQTEYFLVTPAMMETWRDVSIRIDIQSIRVLEGSQTPLFQHAYKEELGKLPVGSLEEGLRIILTPLFQKFNIQHLEFKGTPTTRLQSWPRYVYPLVMEIYKENHGYHDMFQKLLWPQLDRILTESSSLYVMIPPKYQRTIEWTDVHLNREGITCRCDDPEPLTVLEELLKGWYQGLYRLIRIWISGYSDLNDISTVFPTLAASFGPQCIWKSFTLYDEYNDSNHEDPTYEGFFRRPSDDVILCISHKMNRWGEHFLYIYDHAYSGPFEEFKFSYDQYDMYLPY